MVCIDIDGTLVGSDGMVHESVWPAVERAKAAGIQLVVCTGRPAFGLARDYATRLHATGWHSFQNGASVVRLADGATRSQCLDAHITRSLIARARASGDVLELYTDATYVFESTSARAEQHALLLGVPFAPRAFESVPGDVVRAQWVLSHEGAAAMLADAMLGVEIAPSTSPVMPDTTFVGITRAGVTKGTAVRTIAAEYGVPLHRVMFIGDGGNDVPALNIVGCAVAMRNAEPGAIAAAQIVVGDVDRGGVAEALDLAIRSRGVR